MGSRPWRRTCVPPMPALIPIAALRANKQHLRQQQQSLGSSNNNTTAGECTPCGQRCPASDNDDEDEDDVDDDEVRWTTTGGGQQEAVSSDEVTVKKGARGVEGGRQRGRRRPLQLDGTEPIDETTSRDRSGPQAPARRARPERHRKSDRRRHRSDRLLRKRSTSDSTTSSACSATSTTNNNNNNNIKRRHHHHHHQHLHHSHHHHHHHQSQAGESTRPEAEVAAAADGRPPTNPRVNPIFVWVRQEDTRIVDVRCEDYDKRNRILLTKTAHGWRAIPRTETLATTLEEASASNNTTTAAANNTSAVEQEHEEPKPQRKTRSRKSGKTKRCRPAPPVRSPSPSPITVVSDDNEEPSSPAWSAPVNVESHLPSHTIPIPRRSPTTTNNNNNNNNNINDETLVHVVDSCSGGVSDDVNSSDTQAQTAECCAIVSDVSSPLDNLLAVAELEFKQHQQQSNQEDAPPPPSPSHDVDHSDDNDVANKDFDIDQLNSLVDINPEEAIEKLENCTDQQQSEDCDYNEDDENHMSMTDILERLEQSLQSPMEGDLDQELPEEDGVEEESNSYTEEPTEIEEEPATNEDDQPIEISDDNTEQGENEEEEEEEEEEGQVEEEPSKMEDAEVEEPAASEYQEPAASEYQKTDEAMEETEEPTDLSVKTTSITENKNQDISEDELLPTDLTINTKNQTEESQEIEEIVDDEIEIQPTDLSIRKHSNTSPAPSIERPRPPSQNSETIQSPQPSGIPAVPPSPDIFSTKSNKSLFLESLLSSASPKLALNSEVTITRNQKEPLDLGKSRKSASPTVSCSEEVKTKFNDGEPATKRVKVEDITLKNLLLVEKQKSDAKIAENNSRQEKQEAQNVETSRLLELLTSDNEPDPVTQLKQLLADKDLSIPDPLLVPKERLSLILSSPAREIPKLLTQRPELRLPEAWAIPQLLQDPDILVITLAQLQTIIHKQSQPIALQEPKPPKETKPVEKPSPKPKPKAEVSNTEYQRYQNSQHQQMLEAQIKHQQQKESIPSMRPPTNNGLANDIDAATTAAFNQMLWLPYLNHLEAAAMACGNNSEFLKALNSVFPATGNAPYPNHMPEMPSLFGGAGAPRFGSLPPPGMGFPSVQAPAMDYANPLEMAMWQEAMMQANLQQQQQQQNQQRSKMDNMKHPPPSYREAERNTMLNNSKKYSSNQRVHSSARTSPISHFHQQRVTPNMQHQQFMHTNPAYQHIRHNLQIPQYHPSLSHQQQQMLMQHQQQVAANAAAKRPSISSSSSYRVDRTKPDQKQYQNSTTYKYNQYQMPKMPMMPPQKSEPPPSPTQKPRVTCKSLQNLLSPKRIEENNSKVTTKTQPMDLSGPRPAYSKLKVKQNLMDPSSFAAKMWKHDDIAEVGSTTEEMTTSQLHETQTHLWHPLFGK